MFACIAPACNLTFCHFPYSRQTTRVVNPNSTPSRGDNKCCGVFIGAPCGPWLTHARLLAPGGTVNPLPCGNVTVYCTARAGAPLTVSPGFYSDVAEDATTFNASLMSRQVPCLPGAYCVGGVLFSCPAATYNSQSRMTSLTDCKDCLPGYYCGTCLPTAVEGW